MRHFILGLVLLLLAPVAAQAAYPTSTIAALTAQPSFVSLQSKIAVTGTAVQLPSNVLVNGLVCVAKATNTASIEIGPSGVTNTADGTGNGVIVPAGTGWNGAVNNSNLVYINGTAGDIVSCWGN